MGEVVVTALGVIATVISALSLLPRVVRTCRTPRPGTWLAVALLSMAMWIAYGGVTGAHAFSGPTL
jgi:hypothetical protein